MSASPPRILIVTAAFGDGHNSAARHLAEAFRASGASVRVRDYLEEAGPQTNRNLVRFYRWAINHFPRGWSRLYVLAGRARFNRSYINYFARACHRIRRSVNHWQPDAVVSTYPLYPFLFERLVRRGKVRSRPLHTVVTDSISINPVWFKAHSDHYFVTDNLSRTVLIEAGVPAPSISATGFPVPTSFATPHPILPLPGANEPCRVLYLTTGRAGLALKTLHSLNRCRHPLQLTVVMGRAEAKLREPIEAILPELNYPVELHGWTDRVPEFMRSHHVGITKAGGATVHEARAACLPLLLNYIVPGQEEGNAELLVQQKCGYVLAHPDEAGHRLSLLLARDCRVLQQLREELALVSRPAAAADIAAQVLGSIVSGTSGPSGSGGGAKSSPGLNPKAPKPEDLRSMNLRSGRPRSREGGVTALPFVKVRRDRTGDRDPLPP